MRLPRTWNWAIGGLLQRLSRFARRMQPPARRSPRTGELAPDFALETESGERVQLSELVREHAVLLVFYPGDHTPVCTRQLCEVRDSAALLAAKGVIAFGVNPAPARMHASFRSDYQLPFPLLVDAKFEAAHAYGARLGVIVRRTVVLIDRARVIRFLEHGNPPLDEVLASLPGKDA